MQNRNLTAVGRIAKVFGREGELSVHLYDTFPEDFKTSEPLFISNDGLAVPLFCDRFHRRGQRGATIVFADIDSERRSAELIGSEICLEFSALDDSNPDDNLYWEDLVGYTAFLGKDIQGTVTDFAEGDNPLFQVDIQGQEAWIPAVDDLIIQIDADKKEIRFDLPEGLLELYL